MSRRVARLPDAGNLGRLSPPAEAVARFRRDLGELIDVAQDRVLVAVSGGADSIALLLLAHAALGDRCSAATVDHGIRDASAGEARHVAMLCAQRGIGHAILSGPLPQRVGRTMNLSARARLLRYTLLDRHAADVGEAWLATGHHADDQVETVMMRLNRGAGVAGLAGIRRTGVRTIRPLLRWRRAELARLVAACGIPAVDDPSNVDDRFDRARLRKVLADADWLDAGRIGMSAAALGDAADALEWTARRLMRERCTGEGDALLLDTLALPGELARRLVLQCIERIDPGCDPTGPAVRRLIESVRTRGRGMLGDVLVTREMDARATSVWRFRLAPPRRTH